MDKYSKNFLLALLITIAIIFCIVGAKITLDSAKRQGRSDALNESNIKNTYPIIQIGNIGKVKLTSCDTTIYIRPSGKVMIISQYYDFQ